MSQEFSPRLSHVGLYVRDVDKMREFYTKVLGFVVSDAVMQPILREAAKRGLGYLDDGAAPRSVAATIAAGQTVPFAKADISIDAVPTAVEIDRALAKLETLAKERGMAVGIASALPISIERIGVWTKALESRGIMLAPLTTAMLKSKSG